MLNKKIIVLAIFFVSLLAVSAVSAAENATDIVISDASNVVSAEETTDEFISTSNGTNGDVISVSSNNENEGKLEITEATFTQLNNKIQNAESGEVKLTQNYLYVQGSDNSFVNGITINKPITINGNWKTIDGSSLSSVFNIQNGNVIIMNLKIINANQVAYGNLNNVSLINIQIDNAKRAIYGSTNNLIIDNVTFSNCRSTSKTSAISVSGSNVIISNSKFNNNGVSISYQNQAIESTVIGGAVYLSGNNHQIINSTFDHNYLNVHASDHKSQRIETYGGAIFLTGNNCTISNSNFTYNYARSNVYYYDKVRATGTTISEGGAIYWSGDGDIINSSFICNYAFAITDMTAVDVNYGILTASATAYGGAVYRTNLNKQNSISNSIFINNYVKGHGIRDMDSEKNLEYCDAFGGVEGGLALYWNGNEGIFTNLICEGNNYSSVESYGYNRANVATFTPSSFKIIGANCTLISSSFVSNNAIEWSGKGAANYNIFIKPTERYYFEGNSGLNVDYNWWGSNNNPYSLISGSTCDNWICSNLAIDNLNIVAPIIYTKLNTLSDGDVLSDEDYAKLPVRDVTYTLSGSGRLSSYNSDTSSTVNYLNDKTGEYTVTITSKVDNQKTVLTQSIIVDKWNTKIIVNNYTVTYGDDLTIEVYTKNSNVTGNISLIVNNEEYTENIIGDKATFKLPKLDAGSYIFNATYNGNSFYHVAKTNGIIIVEKLKDFNIGANYIPNEIKYGDQIVLNVIFSKNLTGTVSFDINNIKYTENVIDNKATFILNNLNAGKYEITPVYSGDINHEAKNTTICFSIAQLDSIVNVVVKNNITYGETATITITTNADGKSRIKIGTFETTVDVINKTALINIPNLNADNEPYSVEALFYDVNNNYKNSTGFATLRVSKAKPIFNIIVNNVNYDEQAIMNVSFKKDINGFANIVIKDNNGFELKFSNVIINNGELLQDLTKLDVSKYTITFEYLGNNNYNSTIISKSFNVFKCDPIITVTVTNATYGQTAKITANSNTEGNITIAIGTDKTYNELLITGGSVSQNVNDIGAGTYDVKVTYNGNNNYNIKTVKTKLTIYKVSTTVIATADDITYPQTVVVNVKASVNGEVTVKIDNNYINSTNVVANTVTPITFNNIPAGVHNISVLLTPSNKNYNESSHNADFTVSKKQTSLTLGVENSVYGEEVIINVTASEDGKITLKVGSIIREKNVLANTMVKINFGVLAADSYNVEATFDAGENFKLSTKQTTLAVSPAKAEITAIQVQNNTYGENTIIYVKTNIAGVLTVKLNNANAQTFNIDANKLTALDLGKYDVNNYDIDLSLDAGSNYTKATGNTKVTVNPKQTTVELNVKNSVYGENVIVNITASENGKVTINVGTNVRIVDVEANKRASFDFGILDAQSYEVNATFDGGKNYQTSSDKTSFVVSPKASTVNLVDFVNSYVYGQNVIIKMKSDADGTLTVKVGDTPQTKQITAGNIISFDFGILNVNTYGVTINLTAVNNYIPYHNNTSITVTPKSTSVTIVDSISNYVYPQNVIIKVKSDTDGLLTVKVGDTPQTKQVATGGTVSYDFGILDVNTYAVTISLDAGYNYVPYQNTTSILIAPKSTSITLNAKNYDTTEKVIVNVTSSENGKLTIKLDNITKTTDVTANTVTSVDFGILDVGLYNIIANFTAGNNYINSTAKSSIKVLSKINDEDVNISIPEIIANQENDIIVNLPDGATGIVTLIIGNNTYPFTVSNGIATVKVPKLADGNYDYIINYSGDDQYSSFSTFGNIDVSKPTPEVAIPPLDKPSSDGSITVNLPKGATGTITLVINKKSYSFPVSNGIAKIYMPELANGNYDYLVTYSGDSRYSSFTKTGKLTINKTTPKPAVKTTLTLKTVKVKKSAKKIVLQATLKEGNAPIAGVKITFKFNGKKYVAKTNAKGVAKVTFKSKVLKKLKVGKKVKYQASYDNIIVKKTVKVKK